MADINELLKYINPAELDYSEWVAVGMALKHEGMTAFDWDRWSQADHRYKPGECYRKWGSFNEDTSAPVTGGTIFELARRGGYVPPDTVEDVALDWDSVISRESKDDLQIIQSGWIEDQEIKEPGAEWDPAQDLTTYLQTLFQSTENVGYVTEVYQGEDRLAPKKGCWDRTAGQLLEELRRTKDIGAVFGDWNKTAGAWIRFNPLDGNGIKNENVTDYRFALVESDSIPIAKQHALIRELELPVAALVYSGGKSLHAIVRINAGDYTEYRKRVEYLYKVCDKNGLKVDTQNKNPSRLSRMPGVTRNGRKQFLLATNIGKADWQEWQEWIEEANDDLPDLEPLADAMSDLPPLADPLIDGVLRSGHKLLMAGPSKAGKSFAMIELAIAVARGGEWLGFKCKKGRVMYVNLELDRASCLHRFDDICKLMGIPPTLQGIDVWNLRGMTLPLKKLAPKLVRRGKKHSYDLVIIDPLYKIMEGDENSAGDMGAMWNWLDWIGGQLSCAIAVVHHHSKGAQGGKKSMDRASGSGVFARDPDALLDLSELEPDEKQRKTIEDKAQADGIKKALDEFLPGWRERVPEESQDDPVALSMEMSTLSAVQRSKAEAWQAEALDKASRQTAWRIEATLREFPPFEPIDCWFDYPVHRLDKTGELKSIQVDDGMPKKHDGKSWRQKLAESQHEKAQEGTDALLETLQELAPDGEPVHYSELAEAMGKSEDSMRKFLARRKSDLKKAGYKYEDGHVSAKVSADAGTADK